MELEFIVHDLIREIDEGDAWEWTENAFDLFAEKNCLFKTEAGNESRINYMSDDKKVDIDLYIKNSVISWIDVAVDVILDPKTSFSEEYETNINTLRTVFYEMLSCLEKAIGAAQLNISSCPSEMIEFYCAIEIAAWSFNNSVVILKLEHQDSDLPLILDVVVEPNFRFQA